MNKEKNLETCLVISTGLVILWFFYPIKMLLVAAAAIGIIGLFFDRLASIIHWAWYKLAEMMGFVMSKVLLTLVFFVFLAPIAALYRLFNKDSLQLKKKDDSYWEERGHVYQKKDLENVW